MATNNNAPHLKSPKNQSTRAALGRPTIKITGGLQLVFGRPTLALNSALVYILPLNPNIMQITRFNSFTTKKASDKTFVCRFLKTVKSKLHHIEKPGRVVQSIGHLTRKSGFLGSIPGLATYFRFSFRFCKKGSCQLLAKVCTRSTG